MAGAPQAAKPREKAPVASLVPENQTQIEGCGVNQRMLADVVLAS
jgi:hypothetical protein